MTFKRLLVVILVVVLPPLVLWIYLPSWTHFNELKRQDELLKRQLAELKDKNRSLERESFLLKNDVRYLEKVLREELNVIRPDETVYKLVPAEELDGVVAPPVAKTEERTVTASATTAKKSTRRKKSST